MADQAQGLQRAQLEGTVAMGTCLVDPTHRSSGVAFRWRSDDGEGAKSHNGADPVLQRRAEEGPHRPVGKRSIRVDGCSVEAWKPKCS
jgi:hypothetical protein